MMPERPVAMIACKPVESPARNEVPATRSEAPPPKPLRSATIWGMPVMGVERASQTPMPVPTRRAAATRVTLRLSVCRTVMTIASSMPKLLMVLPLAAERGEDIILKATMKHTAAMR